MPLKPEVIHPENRLGKFLSKDRRRQLRLAKRAREEASRLYEAMTSGSPWSDIDLADTIDLLHALSDEIDGKRRGIT